MSHCDNNLFTLEPVIGGPARSVLTANERIVEVIQLGKIAKTILGGKLEAMLESGVPSLNLEMVLLLLNKHRVEFLVVGGYAVAFHGYPRFTRDLDLFYHQTPENADRILAALNEAGFSDISLTTADLLHPQLNYKLGRPPNQIDLNPDIKGVAWADADRVAKHGEILGQPVRFVDFDTLIASKRAAGRAQDLADIEGLMRHLGEL